MSSTPTPTLPPPASDDGDLERDSKAIDAYWRRARSLRLRQHDENSSFMDSDFWRPVVLGFVGGGMIGSMLGVTDFFSNLRSQAASGATGAVARMFLNATSAKGLACSGCVGKSSLAGPREAGLTSRLVQVLWRISVQRDAAGQVRHCVRVVVVVSSSWRCCRPGSLCSFSVSPCTCPVLCSAGRDGPNRPPSYHGADARGGCREP